MPADYERTYVARTSPDVGGQITLRKLRAGLSADPYGSAAGSVAAVTDRCRRPRGVINTVAASWAMAGWMLAGQMCRCSFSRSSWIAIGLELSGRVRPGQAPRFRTVCAQW